MKFAQALFMNSNVSSVRLAMPALGVNHLWTQLIAAATAVLPHLAMADRPNRSVRTQLGPYSLVNLAHEGGLVQQGIPSQQTLVNAHRLGQVTARRLVESAVRANLVSRAALSDAAYLDAVETGFWFHAFAAE